MTPAKDSGGPSAGRPAEDIEDMDPGLARERTELAWTRTAISFAALGGAILKVSPIGGVLILGVSGLVWETGRLARRSGRRGALSQRRMLLLITIAVTVVSLVALGVALFGSGKSPLTTR
jgi:uncharacterized membrane protein YidH (DUF202 family)